MGNAHSVDQQLYAVEQEHRKLEILGRVDSFPITLRETIHATREEDTKSFLSIVEERLVDLLYGNEGDGLDCDRDTHEEIETAIRFFPHALCEKYWGTHPPIYAQLAYFKSVSFIPLLARLGIELNQFQKEERGGLFYREWNVLRSLVNNDSREWYDEDDDQQYLVDEKYVEVMKALEEMGIFTKKDILEEDLMSELSRRSPFPERRFRYLVDCDPDCFHDYCIQNRHLCRYEHRPSIYKRWIRRNNIRVFQIILELGTLHFPTEMGFLFHSDQTDYQTPFILACRQYGTERVTDIVGNLLISEKRNYLGSNCGMDWLADALIYAATNSAVHLDGVYFLLRRDPSRFCCAISR